MSLILLVALASFVLLNISVQQLVDFEAMGLEVDNTQDARVKAGSLLMRSVDRQDLGIFDVSWLWCPSGGFLNWCTEIKSEALQARGQLNYRISGWLNIADMDIVMDSLSLFGVMSAIVDAELVGRIETLDIQDFACPLRNAENMSAQFEMRQPQLLGNLLKDFRVDIGQLGQEYLLKISGQEIQGEFAVDAALRYSGEGEMIVPPNLRGLMDNLAIPLGNNRYGWKLDGEIPC